MSAQIPSPATLAQRFAAALGSQQFTASDGTTVTLDATAPATLESALAILSGLSDYEIYLYLRDQLLELMVTTATVTPGTGLLPKHAEIWGVPRVGATAAVGYFIVSVSSAGSVTLPAGTLVTVDGSAQWSVVTAVTIGTGASASVAVQATATGTAGNLAANTAGTLVSPIAGVQSVISDQNGLAGGAPIEGVEAWRARIIDAIRTPNGGGAVADYEKWATAAGAAYVSVVPGWLGRGTVGVIVAMAGGVAATPAQVAAIQAYLDDGRRPVRGNVTVASAVIAPQTLNIQLNPDTVAARADVTAALAPFYLSVGIGGTAYREAIENAISSATGVFTNSLRSPVTDVTFAENQMPTLGVINWSSVS
ncbi:hypothetical protein AD929_11690 [Gluconobacter potus]|uniref:Uncharacterized protein n=1 Tax=Gluconobacter potus TaxID=2724927 RepID=A0A149QT45_9PROT|nr:baseplate J/gp47 family protein [Gluconobacter potus]KXV00287.1 hypothetical protein AD929_11690 [Gluconobacter potus]